MPYKNLHAINLLDREIEKEKEFLLNHYKSKLIWLISNIIDKNSLERGFNEIKDLDSEYGLNLYNEIFTATLNNKGDTVLHYAILCNNIEAVKLLIENDYDVDLNKENNSNYTPLLLAIQNNNHQIVDILKSDKRLNIDILLLSCCENIFYILSSDDLYKLILHITDKEILEKKINLIKKAYSESESNLDLYNDLLTTTPLNNNGDTALIIAVNHYNKAFIEILKEKEEEVNIEVNLKNKFDETALHYAAKLIDDKENIMGLLLSFKGINIEEVNLFGNTALHHAVFYNNIEAVKLLIKNDNIDLNKRNNNNYTPLLFAVQNNNKEMVNILISDQRTDINTLYDLNKNILHIAIEKKFFDIAKLILQNTNLDINALDDYKNTALHFAAQYDMEAELVQDLIDINGVAIKKNAFGDNPLHYSIYFDNLAFLKVITKNIKDLNIYEHGYQGNTVLDLAIKDGKKETISILMKYKLINYRTDKLERTSFSHDSYDRPTSSPRTIELKIDTKDKTPANQPNFPLNF